jgi:hypothetical protein
MKTRKRLLFLFAFVFLSFISRSIGQETHTITLTVQEDGSYSFSVFPESSFLSGDTPETYTILVNEGDTIEWEGVAESGVAVEIESIAYVADSNNPKSKDIFNEPKIHGKKDNGNKKKVKAKVKPNKKNSDYKYIIEFTVDGEPNSIDPGVKVGN